MQTETSQPNRSRSFQFFLVTGIVGCLLLMIVGIFYDDFRRSGATAFERLEYAAEQISESILDELQRGDIVNAEEALTFFSKKYNISLIRLYDVDGTLLVPPGNGSGAVLEKPHDLNIRESGGWPLAVWYQYSQIIHSGKTPLAILVLSTDKSGIVPFFTSVTPWFTAGLAGAIAVLLVLLIRSQRAGGSRSLTQGRAPHHRAETTGVGKDIEETMAELREERDRALASAMAKESFLASMSHEIRTPMNGIIGVLSLLRKSGLQGENHRLLQAAVRSADSLVLIINDILDFAKIEAGKIDFEVIAFDLRAVVEESLLLYRDAAHAKNIELLCYIPLEIPAMVLGDPTRLRQVVTNLISNAVKFTDKGEVNLHVEVLDKTSNGQQLRFTIKDTGIGIAPEKLTHLFDPFFQAEGSTTRNYGGTGLGLSVCKNLIELQGGECGVSSRPGKGTTFWFSLPFKVDSHSGPVLPCAGLNGKKIAIFDASETSRTILDQYLKGCEIETRVGSDRGEVIKQLQLFSGEGFTADVIMVDSNLIVHNFSIFLEEIRSVFAVDMPEIYVLNSGNGVGQGLLIGGASGIISKPYRLSQLYGELCGESSFYSGEAYPEETEEQLQGTVLLVDDEPINRRVGEALLRKIGLVVETVDNGREALAKTALQGYDLLLLDIQMPEMSGFEVVEKIRAREKETDAPRQIIIAVTGNVQDSVRERCLALGMDGFIAKPIIPELLVEHLRPWLTDNTAGEVSFWGFGKRAVAQNKEGHAGQVTAWDRTLALDYVGGDEELLQDLARLYLQRKGTLCAALERAIESGDAEQIADAAHACKGAVNHFAARNAQELARVIEDNARSGSLDNVSEQAAQLAVAAALLDRQLQQYLDSVEP